MGKGKHSRRGRVKKGRDDTIILLINELSKLKYLKEKTILPYMEAYASNPSTQEGEAEKLLQV